MANSDNARGLTVATMQGGVNNGMLGRYYVPASDGTAIYKGGLVKLTGTGDAKGVPGVTGNVVTGDAVIGVVDSIEPVTHDSKTYREASTARYVNVIDNPNVTFEIQEDSVGGALTAANIGNTADIVGFTNGDTGYGISTLEIDSSTATATGDGTQDVVLLGAVQRDDNEIGANAKWLVRLNNHFKVDGQVGV